MALIGWCLLAIPILLLVPGPAWGQDLECDRLAASPPSAASPSQECKGTWECTETLGIPPRRTASNFKERIAVSRFSGSTTLVFLIDAEFPEGTEVEIVVDGGRPYRRKTVSQGVEIGLDAELAKALRRGSRAAVTVRASGGEVQKLESSLAGFGFALWCVCE